MLKARLGDYLSALVFMALIWSGQRITFNQLELFVLICIEDWGEKDILSHYKLFPGFICFTTEQYFSEHRLSAVAL